MARWFFLLSVATLVVALNPPLLFAKTDWQRVEQQVQYLIEQQLGNQPHQKNSDQLNDQLNLEYVLVSQNDEVETTRCYQWILWWCQVGKTRYVSTFNLNLLQ